MSRDNEWIIVHFEELVDKYGGKWIGVANQELFIGDSPKEVEELARRKHPNIVSSVMHVPREEALQCIL